MISAIKTNDEGIIIAANFTACFGTIDTDILLLKYDQDLQLQWDKKIITINNQFVHEIIQNSSGNFVMLSSSVLDKWYIAVTEFSPTGDIIWEKLLDTGDEYGSTTIIESINQTYLLTGNWNPPRGLTNSNFSLTEVSSTGDLLEKKYFESIDKTEHGITVQQNPIDGNLAIIGSTPGSTNDLSPLMKFMKLDSSNEVLFQRLLGGSSGVGHHIKASTLTNDNHILVSSFTNAFTGIFRNYRAQILKVDWEGNIIWRNLYQHRGNITYVDTHSNIYTDSQGNIYLPTYVSHTINLDMYLLKIAPNG